MSKVIDYRNILTTEQVASMFNAKAKTIINKNSDLHKFYLGNNLFVRDKIEDLKYEYESKEWFCKEISLFIEFLNKLDGISYEKIAKKARLSCNVVATHRLGQKACAKILVAWKSYVKDFETYYRSY